MCGIAGVLSLGAASVGDADLRPMTDIVAHRGPDGEGHLLFDLTTGHVELDHGTEGRVASPSGKPFLYLGHRRLAIIDVSSAGAQPMASEDASAYVTYNGEIYNYLELRDELASRGHHFHTGSDTEVLLHAYGEWGTDCFARFNGMWALAILDVRTRRLVLCLDRFGIKPLHYVARPGLFAFGSEIKQLLPLAGGARENATAVAEYVATGITLHSDQTCFDGVRRMMPGQIITVDLDTGERTTRTWYTLPHNLEYGAADDRSFAMAAERFRELFVDAVTLRLRSDVPVGSCLSGGLDSSAIVGVASRLARSRGAGPLLTFTSCWDDPAIDESAYADTVVQANGCAGHRVFPTWEQFRADLDQLLWHQEEPFSSPSMFAQWAVMRLARQHGVPVLLDGQGSDEMLGGYEGNVALQLRDAVLASPVQGLQRALAMRASGYRVGIPDTASALLPAVVEGLYRRRIRRAGGQSNGTMRVPRSWGEKLHAEYTRGHLQTLLRYEDRSSMAFSIESRCPFMDYRVAEFVFSLPRAMLSHGALLKALLRTGLAEDLPPAVAKRTRKYGFWAPRYSIDGPEPMDTGSSIAWRRKLVARWRQRFGLPARKLG
jgi:asparagine synthase (glutamine-hydrolysing)